MNRYKPATSGGTCACFTSRITGEPYSGNLYLRFDEDLGLQPPRLLYRHSGQTLPTEGVITQIKFGVKFKHEARPKVVKITNANRAEYKCNEHAEAIERWLNNRGFIVTGGDSGE